MRAVLHRDYREFIRQNYHDRTQRNPAYSLRAYARDLGIAYSRLHDTINGRKGLSAKSACKIASKLNLNETEKDIFVTKIEAEHARSPIARKKAQEKLEQLRALYGGQVIDENLFQLIKDWHHFAIVELSSLADFKNDPDWISKRLNIGIHEVKTALDRLQQLGVMQTIAGKLQATEEFSFTDSDIPSDAIKQNHEQILHKARQALYFQSLEERDFNSFTFSCAKADLPLAKKFIKEFLIEFDRKFAKNVHRDTVYSLSTQLIRLDKGDSHENK